MSAEVLVIAGYGLNCEEETLYAFEYAGLSGKIMHINDLIEAPETLKNVQVLAIPGGFSYGDDTGSGNAFAQKMKLALQDELLEFVGRDTLTIGICNGCQILCNLGLVPGIGGNYKERSVTATYNLNDRYECRWIDMKTNETNSPWLQGVENMHIPVAHGEGRFMMSDETLKQLQQNNQIAMQFVKPDRGQLLFQGNEELHSKTEQNEKVTVPRLADGKFPYNPNGSVADIAGITDESGRILAIMPHPERGMFTWQRDDYMELKDKAQRSGIPLPEDSDGIALFQNAAAYFEIGKGKKYA